MLYTNVPFGGKKQSGIGQCLIDSVRSSSEMSRTHLEISLWVSAVDTFLPSGRELGANALDEYLSVKAIHWNYGDKQEWPL